MKKPTPPPPRNFVAKHAKRSGAGSHSLRKYSRKEKHKGRDPFKSDHNGRFFHDFKKTRYKGLTRKCTATY